MRAKDTLHKVSTRLHQAVFRASKGRLLGTIVGLPVVELERDRNARHGGGVAACTAGC